MIVRVSSGLALGGAHRQKASFETLHLRNDFLPICLVAVKIYAILFYVIDDFKILNINSNVKYVNIPQSVYHIFINYLNISERMCLV